MTGGRNTSSLATELRERLGELLQRPVDVRELRRVPGGASHETWACDLVDGSRVEPLMVRRDIAAGLLETDGAAEFALLGVLHEHGLPVPRPWLRAGDVTVMERVPGQDARKVMASADHSLDARALGEALVEIQAALHALDWRTSLARVLPEPADEVERWAQVVAGGSVDPEPLLQAAISWLRAHPSRPVEPRLVHADFKANNLLVSPDGRLTVIDWEMAHAGDPVEDLAWTLLWDTGADVVGGMLAREEYLAAYAAASGAQVDEEALFFWELLALVKLAAIFLTGVRPGAASLPTLQMLGRAVPHLEVRIAERLTAALRDEAA